MKLNAIYDIIDPIKLSKLTGDKQVVINKRLIQFGKTLMKPGKFIRKVAKDTTLTDIQISNFVSMLFGELKAITFEMSISKDFKAGYFSPNIHSCMSEENYVVNKLVAHSNNISIVSAKIGDEVYGRALLFNDETNIWLSNSYGSLEAKVTIHNFAKDSGLLREKNLVCFEAKDLVDVYLDDYTINRGIVLPSTNGTFIKSSDEDIRTFLETYTITSLEESDVLDITFSNGKGTKIFIDIPLDKVNPLNVTEDWATITVNNQVIDLYYYLIQTEL